MAGTTGFFTQANPRFEHHFPKGRVNRTGEKSTGDRARQIENFTRVEVHGFPEAHWVKVIVDPDDAAVFSFREQIVEKNRFRR